MSIALILTARDGTSQDSSSSYTVLKAPFFGAHPQSESKFLDSLQRMDETNLVRIPDCIPAYILYTRLGEV